MGDKAKASVRRLLMTTEPITLQSDPAAVSAAMTVAGTARGRLIGGHLQMVATSVGVRMPPMDGAILFPEYHRTGLGTIDRYLTQLRRSGMLDGIVGVVLGSFESSRGFSDRDWELTDVLGGHLAQLDVPVLGGIHAGHDLIDERGGSDQYAVPLGSLATLDTGAGTLTVEPVVR